MMQDLHVKHNYPDALDYQDSFNLQISIHLFLKSKFHKKTPFEIIVKETLWWMNAHKAPRACRTVKNSTFSIQNPLVRHYKN